MRFGDLFDRAATHAVEEEAIVRALAARRTGEEGAETSDDESAG